MQELPDETNSKYEIHVYVLARISNTQFPVNTIWNVLFFFTGTIIFETFTEMVLMTTIKHLSGENLSPQIEKSYPTSKGCWS
jgi:hypothetical protein